MKYWREQWTTAIAVLAAVLAAYWLASVSK